ncbi:MAG: DedA family protein, partial [Muribaculaceae bacterium]
MFAENANYWFVFAFMVIESSFIPFPSEIVVPPAAYFAATRGDISVVGIVAVATAGAIVGALINYGLSLWIGRPLVYKFANSRFGHACLIDQAKVEKAE